MPIPSVKEAKEALRNAKKEEEKKARERGKQVIEEISGRLLEGKLVSHSRAGSPATVAFVLESFRKKGYDVEAEITEYKQKGRQNSTRTAVYTFTIEED